MNPFFAQLESALEQRQQQGAPLQLFLRDDDVDEDEASLRRLLALCLRNETPINLGVIPGRLTAAAIEMLRNDDSRRAGLTELNQHGWLHLNHEAAGKKCEFGPSRDFAAQLADLAVGQERMNAAFGEAWFPVFIPPWNRCTAATAQALDQLGFLALSRDFGQQPFPGSRFCELPVTLDLYAWRGGPRLRPVEELARELIEQVAGANRIGLLLHHKVMDDAAFALLAELLHTFKQFPIVRFHTFQSLLELT